MGERNLRVVCVGVCLLTGLVACAEKTPPPHTPQAATAPLTTPVAAGVPAGPPIELMAAAAARPCCSRPSRSARWIAAGNGTKLVGQAMPLPMDAAGLRDMMLSQAGLPPEVAANMDFASPSAAAFVALDGKGKSGAVMAVPARGPAEAQKIIDALGKKITTRGPATLVEGNTGGRGWLYRSGNIVVLSDEADALARGTMLTLEARRAGADDVTAVLYPGGDRARERHRRQDRDRQVPEGDAAEAGQQRGRRCGGDAAARENSLQAVGEALALAGDASSIEASLVADPAKGLIVHARFNARPGTKLESVAKEVKPFSWIRRSPPPAPSGRFIVGGEQPGAVLARRARDLPRSPGRGQAEGRGRGARLLRRGAGGDGRPAVASLSLYKEAPYLSGAFASAQGCGQRGQVASRWRRWTARRLRALLRAQLGDASSVRMDGQEETVGKLKTQHFRVKMKKKSAPRASDMSKRLMGQTLDVYWAVADTRMLMTLGKDAKTRLTAIASGKAPPEPNKAVAEAQAAAAARDLFFYIDLTPVLGVVGSLTDEQRLAALAKGGGNPIPVVFTAGGDGAGKLWTMDLTVPVAAFAGSGIGGRYRRQLGLAAARSPRRLARARRSQRPPGRRLAHSPPVRAPLASPGPRTARAHVPFRAVSPRSTARFGVAFS